MNDGECPLWVESGHRGLPGYDLPSPDPPRRVYDIPPNWDIYTAYTRAPETWSLEFVMYDAEGRWALLADADVTVFGAEPSLANEIDEHLVRQGTDLEAMTREEWGDLDPVTQPGAKYILAVTSPSD